MVAKPIDLEKRVKESALEVLARKRDLDPYHTIYGMTRRGRTLSRAKGVKNFKTEVVYSLFKVDKDESMGEKDDGPYTQDRIIIDDNNYSTNNLFRKHVPKTIKVKDGKILREHEINKYKPENLEKLVEEGEILNVPTDQLVKESIDYMIESVFGDSTSKVFHYANEKHLQTKEKRKGTNYYFSHIVRVAYSIKEVCENTGKSGEYTKAAVSLALLHDVVESMQKHRRKKKISKLDSLKSMEKPVIQRFTNDIEKLNRQLDNPPELSYREIGRFFYKKSGMSEKMILMVRAISNYNKEDYEKYIRNMYIVINNEIRKNPDDLLYDVIPLVKVHDAIDNTKTLEEADADSQLERLRRNAILADHTYKFMQQYGITKDENATLLGCVEKLMYETEVMARTFEKKYMTHSGIRAKEESKVLQEDAPAFKIVASQFKTVNKQIQYLNEQLQIEYVEKKLSENNIKLK